MTARSGQESPSITPAVLLQRLPTCATVANLNNLGQGFYNTPTVGSSQDVAFQTTNPGSFLANNPVGETFNFGVAPVANFGWSFTVTAPAVVPETNTLALLALGAMPIVGAVTARRKKS